MDKDPTSKFRMSETQPENYFWKEPDNSKTEPLKQFPDLPQFKHHNCSDTLQHSPFPQESRFFSNNGFVSTVLQCSKGNHNLIIRPDDIWTTIMIQTSFYTRKHSSNQATANPEIQLNGNIRDAPLIQFFNLVGSEVRENVMTSPEQMDWILPSFSSTTETDIVTSGLIYVSEKMKYSKKSSPGNSDSNSNSIPFVTLEGSLADWENVLERVQMLKEVPYQNLNDWYQMLDSILVQFLKAKRGSPDINFWEQICTYHPGEFGSSGFISGWITAFCVFRSDGKWQGQLSKNVWLAKKLNANDKWPILEVGDIPPGILEVELEIEDRGEGISQNYIIFMGHMALEILDEGFALKPTIGWVVCCKLSQEEIKKQQAIKEIKVLRASGWITGIQAAKEFGRLEARIFEAHSQLETPEQKSNRKAGDKHVRFKLPDEPKQTKPSKCPRKDTDSDDEDDKNKSPAIPAFSYIN